MNSRFWFLILTNLPIVLIRTYLGDPFYNDYAASGTVDPTSPFFYLFSYVLTLLIAWATFYWLFFLRPHAHDYRSLSPLRKVTRAFAYAQVSCLLTFATMYLEIMLQIRKQPVPSNDILGMVFLAQCGTLGLACLLGYAGTEKSNLPES